MVAPQAASVRAAGASGKQASFHRSESCSCRIADVDQFDEAKFIQTLKESVEKDLGGTGAKIVKSINSDARTFFVDFLLDDTTGHLQISGTQTSATLTASKQI
jgi:hypothetical protein